MILLPPQNRFAAVLTRPAATLPKALVTAPNVGRWNPQALHDTRRATRVRLADKASDAAERQARLLDGMAAARQKSAARRYCHTVCAMVAGGVLTFGVAALILRSL